MSWSETEQETLDGISGDDKKWKVRNEMSVKENHLDAAKGMSHHR